MGVKLCFLACGLFLYFYAPASTLSSIPGQPHSLFAVAGLAVVGPLVYNTLR